MGNADPTKMDPELTRQLTEAANSDEKIAAVLRLHPPNDTDVYPPEQMQTKVRELLSRVAKRVGTREQDSNIFRFMGSFVVKADAPFIQELLRQPEIAAAVANDQDSRITVTAKIDR